MIVAVPLPTAATLPVLSTAAAAVLEDVQVTFLLSAFAGVTVAVS